VRSRGRSRVGAAIVPRMSEPITIDCDYLAPEFAAAYLLVEGQEAAFVETNTAHAVPRLLAALERAGRRPEDVRWVVVTHVHLDHAGGASALMKACPNATLLAHPRAAPHLVDPSKLVASARKVYGDAEFERLYGSIEPVAEERVRVMQDNESLAWGSRTLTFLHTRGHANHHFVVHDSASDAVFTGDAFGLAYPTLQARGTFVLPSTSPTDFDSVEAKRSVDRIVAAGRRAFLTHYGEVKDVATAARQLHEHLDFSAGLLARAAAVTLTGPSLVALCRDQLQGHYAHALEAAGLQPDASTWALLALDLDLNAQGIAWVAEKRRAKA
jgi:glyoxylase-like metal-dependent hydrolase (beta-lactamase superfamily II)